MAEQIRTFNHHEFDADDLAANKSRQGLTVSVSIPARDEEATIGEIIETVRRDLVDSVGLVDEIVVIDDGSADATAVVAKEAGARVVSACDVLPRFGPSLGKGDAMWRSLMETSGDLVCWLDADLRNFSAHFVVGLLGPLLQHAEIKFVKACYARPLDSAGDGGGRVTELVARPALSLLFPELAGVAQPLAGEYAGRRSTLESVPFACGWGVDLGLLIDIAARSGVDAVAQVDLGIREHRNRPLRELGEPALANLVAALDRVDANRALVEPAQVPLFQPDDAYASLPFQVRIGERPPIVSLPEYAAAKQRAAEQRVG